MDNVQIVHRISQIVYPLMTTLIVEDEMLAAERLSILIKQYDSSIEILACLESIEEAVSWLNTHQHPDLIFLDIQLADGLSFSIFEKVEVQSPVIFTTAYDEYALKAFKVNSIDYLLKPIDLKDLTQAFHQFKKINQPTAQLPDLSLFQAAMTMIQQQQQYKSRFIVKRGHHLSSVSVEDVAYFFSEHKITWLKTHNHQKFAVDYTIEQLKDILDPALFFRLNRKYITSIKAISDIVAYSNSRLKIELQDNKDDKILISREKVGDFKKWLDQ